MELKHPDIDKLPKTLKHISRWQNRDSILQIGLLPNIGEVYADYWMRAYPNETLTPAIFLSRAPYISTINSAAACFDIWEVNTNYLDFNKLFVDPAFEHSRKLSFMYFAAIPIDKLTLNKKSRYYHKVIQC